MEFHDRAREGDDAAFRVIRGGDAAFLERLLQHDGLAQDARAIDRALRLAASEGLADRVRVLLAAGADPRALDAAGRSPMRFAATIEVRKVLASAGADLDEVGGDPRDEHDLDWDSVGGDIRRLLTRIEQRPLECTLEEFQAGRDPVVEDGNPVRLDLPFLRAMVASRASAEEARSRFVADPDDMFAGEPIWCNDRVGQSMTELDDGRVIEVAGEHGDHYMPDFRIYNDVVVYDGGGGFTIYGYDEEAFPPTDFHTATRFEEWIYLIGSLGYPEDRMVGTAQVLRLSICDFHVERVETTGDDPGWIHGHCARLEFPATVVVRGGEVWVDEGLSSSRGAYALDLRFHCWTRLDEHQPGDASRSPS